MRTFEQYIASQGDDLARSFAYVGWYISAVNEEAVVGDLEDKPEAKSAIAVIRRIADQFRHAVASAKELIRSLGDDPRRAISTLTAKVKRIAIDFAQDYRRAKQHAQAAGAEVSEGVIGVAKQGLHFLVNSILAPVLAYALNSLGRVVANVFSMPLRVAREGLSYKGFVQGLCLLLLTVLFYPLVAGLGAPAAVTSLAFLWTVIMWVLSWFRTNILTPAVSWAEGEGLRYQAV